ncbi:MAG: hypothetical protein GY850_30395 [bacterium]|nr:hypothetical protein [bacterium]
MLLDEIIKIGNFIFESFLHIWPYLVITIPLAVAINMSGASKYIKRAFAAKPFTAIVLATVVGAFSPFCSCGVIPVIASLLISGVPLAPVMSFWIASPSMDPEIFFLSVGMIGWDLAVWRLVATLVLSFGAGLITHFVMVNGWLGQPILRSSKSTPVQGSFELIRKGWDHIKTRLGKSRPAKKPVGPVGSPSETLLQLAPVLQASSLAPAAAGSAGCNSCSPDAALLPIQQILPAGNMENTSSASCCNSQPPETACCDNATSFKSRLFKETLSATWMVGKFMALAFILEALITFYVPASWITGSLGSQSPLAIFYAALLGVPAYTTSLTALPMVSGLLNQGMNPAAAIAFLIAGPITTLPAMAAVWPLVVRRVFVLYVSFAMVGAVLTGICYSLVTS